MRVIIKESYSVMRIGLIHLLKDYCPCEIISCADVSQTIEAISESRQQIDLLVFGMHTDEVADIKRLLVTAKPQVQRNDIRVLVISEMCESVYAPLCISAGAKGFISPHESVEVVLAAIKAILLGGMFVNRLLARHPVMQQIVHKGELNIFDLFSGREQEIAEYLLKDIPLQDVGDKLNLSYTTVATYRDRILKKANVKQISHLSKLIGQRHES